MRLSIDSIRLRLTLWYAALLALALGAMAIATYSVLDRLASRRAEWSMMETSGTVFATGQRRNGGLSEAVRGFRAPDRRVLVMSRNDSVLATSQAPRFGPPVAAEVFSALPSPALIDQLAEPRRPVSRMVTLRDGDPPVRVMARRLRRGEGNRRLVVIASTAPERLLREQARMALGLAVAATLLLAVIPGSLLVRRSLAPIGAMTRQAARIGAERLGERLPVGNPKDELGALAIVLNDLLDRLQQAFDRQRRFMAEAAHELRTPVAVVRAEAELALSAERAAPQYREALDLIGGEADRLGRIVDDLLTFSRAEAGQYPLRLDDIDLGEVVAEAMRSLRALAVRKQVTLEMHVADELPVRGDGVLLGRLVTNLVENAIKHGRSGDSVRVTAEGVGERIILRVADTGPGIGHEVRPEIFEPFYRGSEARAEGAEGGAGLGLPIARWIAVAHGGHLDLRETGPSGSVFQADFPRGQAD